MPLAWYSEKEDRRYHICLECPYEEVFDDDEDTVVVDDVDEVRREDPHLTLCRICARLLFTIGETCTTTDDYADVEEKLNLQ